MSAFGCVFFMRANTPPNLLIHAADDQVVVLENSILYHKTLQKKNKIFIELYILKEDGYGFGISDSNTATQLWLEITKEWLFSSELLKN